MGGGGGVTKTKRLLSKKYDDESFLPNVSHTTWTLMGDDEEKLLDWSPMSSLAFPHMTDDDENTSAMCNTCMLQIGVTEIPEGVIFQNPLPPGKERCPRKCL